MPGRGEATTTWAGRHAPGLWSFCVTVAYVPLIPSGSSFGRYAAIGAGAAALLWRARIVPSVGHALLAGLLGWMVCGFLWTTSWHDTAGELAVWAILAASFCVAFDLPDLDGVLAGFCAGMLISACFSIGQRAGIDPEFMASWFSSADPVWSVYDKTVWSIYDRPVGLFLSKNMATDAAALAIIACCARQRIVFMPAAAVAFLLVGGRAGFLALGVALACWAWLANPKLRGPIFASAAYCAGIVALLGVAGFFGRYDDRLQIWDLVVRHVTPIGYGLGTFAVAAPGLEYAHNEFLHYAFELGIGSILLWGIFGYALGGGPVLERVMLAAILAQSLVWFPLHAPVPAFLGMVLAGHLCGLRHRAARDERARGMARSLGLLDVAPAGVGALQAADDLRLRADGFRGADLRPAPRRREHLPFGPANQVVARAVRGPVPGDRAEDDCR